ncbi:MAG: hypothetical protein QXU98_09945 [Candidatus Parvarchaeota archaeon]
MYAQKDRDKNANREKIETIDVRVTWHCIERLKERIQFLRYSDEKAVIESLNKYLSEGTMYYDEGRGAAILWFEGMNSIFILARDQDGMAWDAVTFEHTMWFHKKGKAVKIAYKDNTYNAAKMILRATDREQTHAPE